MIALKNISIDENINQLPKTILEEERFAYFYNDNITQAYNQSYLDVILIKNSYELKYKNMIIFSLNNFSSFNKKNSWKKGDELLIKFAQNLISNFNDDLIFRIFGDDFIIISSNNINLNYAKKSLDDLMNKNSMTYRVIQIDLTKNR